MYDTLNGNQVKLFKVPFLIEVNGSFEIQEGLGSFSFYSNGDVVPFKTPYYDYTEDFIVFDYRTEDKPIHIIKDGKLSKSLSLKEMADFEFDSKFKMFGKFGEGLNVFCYEDMLEIIDDFKSYDSIASAIRQKNLKELRKIAAIEEAEEKQKMIERYQKKHNNLEVANAYTSHMGKWIIPPEDDCRKRFGMLKYIFDKSEDVNIKDYCRQEMKQILKENKDFFSGI